MSAPPDWGSGLGRTARALEIPEAAQAGRCGCPRRTVVIVCQLFQRGGCADRQARGVCQCARVYPPCKCFRRPLAVHEHAGVGWEDWRALLWAFDPQGYADPPAAPSPAVAVSHEGRVNLYDERHGPDPESPRLGLFHPDDLLEDESLGISGEPGRRQGGYQTPRLLPDEAADLRRLEACVRKACLTFGSWGRVRREPLAEAGRALAEVARRRLYREVAGTFRDYYRRWGLQAQDVGTLFEAAGLDVREPRQESVPFASLCEVRTTPPVVCPAGARGDV